MSTEISAWHGKMFDQCNPTSHATLSEDVSGLIDRWSKHAPEVAMAIADTMPNDAGVRYWMTVAIVILQEQLYVASTTALMLQNTPEPDA